MANAGHQVRLQILIIPFQPSILAGHIEARASNSFQNLATDKITIDLYLLR